MERENRLKRLKRATWTNGVLAAGTLWAGIITGNSSLFAESLHDTADTLMHGSRYAIDKKANGNETEFQKRIINGGLLFVATLAGVQMLKLGASINLQSAATAHQTSGLDFTDLSLATAIAGGNYYAWHQTSQIHEQTFSSQASHEHAVVDMRVSLGYAAALAIDSFRSRYLPELTPVAGTVLAGYTALHIGNHVIFGGHLHEQGEEYSHEH